MLKGAFRDHQLFSEARLSHELDESLGVFLSAKLIFLELTALKLGNERKVGDDKDFTVLSTLLQSRVVKVANTE